MPTSQESSKESCHPGQKSDKPSDFSHYASSKKLRELAKHPFDLAKDGNLTPERLERFTAESAGYRLLYGTERITDEVMHFLSELSKEAGALDKMEQMQSGTILNFIKGYESENRAVLHTATRDFFEHQNQGEEALAATKQAHNEIVKLKEFMVQIDKDNRFTDLVTIGIGGSDLGPKAHYVALEHLQKKGRHVHFISNVDPDDAAMNIKGLDLSKTLVIVVSKTGTTLETQSNEEFVREYFRKAGLMPENHFISVTSQGSPMDDKKRYLESFYIWDWIGGRYSTTSMVGGVMLSFAFGFDVYWEFLKGCSAMDKQALNPTMDQNVPLLGALLSVWNRTFLHYPTLALIPYSQALSRYSAHIQQVEMESNGKHIDQNGNLVDFATGPVIWGEPGTNAQHSFYQLIHQGTDIIPLEFIGFNLSQIGEDSEWKGTTLQQKLLSNLFAQAIALAVGQKSDNPNQQFQGNRPSHILLGKQLTPFSLGALLGYYEHKVAFEGFIWGINSFDQEGVQLGKVLAKKLIDRFADPKNTQPYPLGDAFLKQLKTI
ncbi:MAG TPA: glucose-6-phosphate isomerase [Parachlamydiaceae bacterium]|nr:glucose-6-phosphate isomerase [Parachlamydiaceae bacterium]